MDNVFVVALIFGYFAFPRIYLQRTTKMDRSANVLGVARRPQACLGDSPRNANMTALTTPPHLILHPESAQRRAERPPTSLAPGAFQGALRAVG